ncbi:MAG: M56 family metallopeptidase [Candidatus Sulfotelmatobacter sp.]|jgi:beta-lactamase regulating signal transducer with metallopeptidase domain
MAIAAQHVQDLAQFFADRMLNSVAVGVVIVAFAWLLMRLLGHQSSSTRFAVWFSALIAIAALPVLEGVRLSHNLVAAGSVSSALRLPASYATEIFAIWAVIASIGLARIAFSFLRLRRLRRGCQNVDPQTLPPALQQTLMEFGLRRRVQICTSPEVRVPAALGFIRAAIVFPAWALTELDPLEMNAVLLHELAHLRRWDDWTNLAQQILRALFFFHPAVWFIGHGLSAEREMACDDFVLAGTSDPGAYARCLVSVAEKTFLHRGLALALAIAGRVHQTTRRVTRILDASRPKATKVWKPALGLVATFSLICLISLPRTPRLVEFESGTSEAMASPANPLPRAISLGTSARMIPASFHVADSNPAAGTNPSSRNATAGSKAFAKLAVSRTAIAAKFVGSQARSPKLMNASSRVPARAVAQPRSVLVVMRTEQLDDSGNVVWSVAVWRLTVFHTANETVRKEIAPKTT